MIVDFESALARVLVREIPGCKRLVSIERLSGGASQETYKLIIEDAHGERPLCLRRATGGVGTAEDDDLRESIGLPTEALLITKAREAGVPEPEVHYVLTEADGLGSGFVMQWLDGETLGARIVRSTDFDSVRPQLAGQCGEILARIHAIELDANGLRSRLPVHKPEHLVTRTWERYKRFNTPQPMLDYAARWLLDHLPGGEEATLVHNDFRNGNLMVDTSGVSAVLDWEIAHIGDPMHDLGWLCTNSWRFGRADLPVGGFGSYDDLFSAYESASGRKVDRERVKFWEVYGSFWWAIGTLTMAEQYRLGSDRSVERPAIGRRCSEGQIDCVNLIAPGPVTIVQATTLRDDDMPRLDELLVSSRDFLREDVVGSTDGRAQFLARVAANSLDIVLRDAALGDTHRRLELERLRALFDSDGQLVDLRWQLVNALRDGSMPLDHPGLVAHLRNTVANQVAIDQPRYSGLATALAFGKLAAKR
ncbi:MAG: phosphotransferase family protein [Betaproteobacteria bacterium]|nr:MAG: phosphotransferase family protein [Betaproteobacteria bacterium]